MVLFSSSFLLLAVTVLLCVHSGCTAPRGSHGDGTHTGRVPMQLYTVDLDQPPELRWMPLLKDFKSSAPLIVNYFEQQAPKLVDDVLKKLMGDLNGYFGELGQEMKAIADYLEIDLGVVVALNFAYELRRLGGGHPNTTGNVTDSSATIQKNKYRGGMACTSIVAQDPTGNVFHGRNLDWNLPDDLRNLTVQANFIKNGEVLFTGDVTVGFVGILTGMSVNRFSLSINERDLGGNLIEDALQALLRHAWSPTHLARQVLTNAQSYKEAVSLLQTEPLIAPVYFITAGMLPNQGAVLTRDRNSLADIITLNATSDQTNNQWYLLETNYDRWEQPEPDDNRRFYGNLYMQSVGQSAAAQFDGLLSVLSTWPISNSYTTYTSLMMPGEFNMDSFDVYS